MVGAYLVGIGGLIVACNGLIIRKLVSVKLNLSSYITQTLYSVNQYNMQNLYGI